MQICMKMSIEARRVLSAEIKAGIASRKWTVSEAAQNIGVDQGHLSRVIRGDFKRLSQNVMQICINLGIDPLRLLDPARRNDNARRRVADSALSLWDGTLDGAEVLISVFGGMAAIRASRRK